MLNIQYQTHRMPTIPTHPLGYPPKSRPAMSRTEQNGRSHFQRTLVNAERGNLCKKRARENLTIDSGLRKFQDTEIGQKLISPFKAICHLET